METPSNQYNSLWLSTKVIHRWIRQNIIPILSRSVPRKRFLDLISPDEWSVNSVTNEFEMNEVCFRSGAAVPNLRFVFSTWAENNGITNVSDANEKCLA